MAYTFGFYRGIEIIIHENAFFFIHMTVKSVSIFEMIPKLKKFSYRPI